MTEINFPDKKYSQYIKSDARAMGCYNDNYHQREIYNFIIKDINISKNDNICQLNARRGDFYNFTKRNYIFKHYYGYDTINSIWPDIAKEKYGLLINKVENYVTAINNPMDWVFNILPNIQNYNINYTLFDEIFMLLQKVSKGLIYIFHNSNINHPHWDSSENDLPNKLLNLNLNFNIYNNKNEQCFKIIIYK